LDSNRFAIFGGFQWIEGREIYLNDLWVFEIRDSGKGSWTKIALTGSVPSPRNRSSLTLIGDNKLVLFGGNALIDGKDDFYGDFFLFDLEAKTSTKFPPTANSKQKKSLSRGHHFMFKIDNSLWMFGGERHRQRLNDLWRFDDLSK
jgi:hypothetical protein